MLAGRRVRGDGVPRLQAGAVARARRAALAGQPSLRGARLSQGVPLRPEGPRADVQPALAGDRGADAERLHPRVQRRDLPPDALPQAALLPGPRLLSHAGERCVRDRLQVVHAAAGLPHAAVRQEDHVAVQRLRDPLRQLQGEHAHHRDWARSPNVLRPARGQVSRKQHTLNEDRHAQGFERLCVP